VQLTKKKIAILALALILVGVVLAALTYTLYYPHKIKVAKKIGLEVYIDGQLWANGTEIDWGSIDITPKTLTKEIAVKNVGTVFVTLDLAVEAPEGFDLTWNYDGTAIAPNGWWNGTLTLNIAFNVENGDYTLDSWITATEVAPPA